MLIFVTIGWSSLRARASLSTLRRQVRLPDTHKYEFTPMPRRQKEEIIDDSEPEREALRLKASSPSTPVRLRMCNKMLELTSNEEENFISGTILSIMYQWHSLNLF